MATTKAPDSEVLHVRVPKYVYKKLAKLAAFNSVPLIHFAKAILISFADEPKDIKYKV